MNLNEKLKSNIIRDFDKRLQTEFSTDLYSFIATIKSDDGDGFHDNVDFIFERDGPKGLRDFLERNMRMSYVFQERMIKNIRQKYRKFHY